MQNTAKIIGIQFSILSPDEIRRSSVAEITSRDTYTNNKPVIGGLFDPRMGVLEPGLICPTDGKNYMESPGYHGHIELARPVLYVQFITEILHILDCVCFKCSKLKISKSIYAKALSLRPEARWKFVYHLAKNVSRCGAETDDGCGNLQPTIKKVDLATITAEWVDKDKKADKMSITVSPEMILKIFKRISDEDISFMGFSPIYSRPEWMICQVLSVPPPSVRPSVKHDAQQRSEDDLTHILCSIIKTNKILHDKIQNNAPANIIDDNRTTLQYFIATQVDNKIPGVAPVAQRSGRPLKSIKERLNGKGGRMRGNLMAKRVDFSARSVITADPNISISELGIPMKIAKNITKPVYVNKLNIDFLTKLVRNGPDVHPGAKLLEKDGQTITLRYCDRESIVLEEGNIVHRHMMNGDAVLFNRQPSLHRMSMMCHIAKIMKRGDTFRMNVADTKPYNADFDGDEMNLHMPQDPESEAELRYLAAVPYQIISPANHKSIIGVYQDSMLGAFQFTRENVRFNARETMNLLMMFNGVNETHLLETLEKNGTMTCFEILTQILPPLSLKYKTNSFSDKMDNEVNSNKILEIRNGQYIRGQMDKGTLADGTKGLLHRICNDYGNMASAKFIDDLQNIVTEYMKTSSFSVGISDLISDQATKQEILAVITKKKQDVKDLIDQIQLGVFENNTGKTNEDEFENQVNNILNKATSESGKIGREKLGKNNRFVIMVNAGSKGQDLNISQMISCIGQQNVDGKRIPYGFENRTLPHFSKFDDSPLARGFVESSYIKGLSPQELFFHAVSGRIGLIDTAVKTSTTGYIQRKLIKALEDLMVDYGFTVRTNKKKIIQFSYGDDNIDTIKVETQQMYIVNMSTQEIYDHINVLDFKSKQLATVFTPEALKRQKSKKEQDFLLPKCAEYTAEMIQRRDDIVKYVFGNKADTTVNCPVAFTHIINNIQGQMNITSASMVDITLGEAFKLIELTYENLNKLGYCAPTKLFETLYKYYLSPKDLLIVKRFNRNALIVLLEAISTQYKRSIVAPGEMVGMLAGQSIGEVSTQMSVPFYSQHKIVMKHKVTGAVEFKSIVMGEFCDGLIEANPTLTFNTGHENSVETLLDESEHEYYIMGVSEDERTSWNQISHVSKHPVNGQMMKVLTRSGRIVETTTSHSHLIRQEHKVVPIVGANMVKGMRIPVCRHIDNSFVVDTYQSIKLDELFGWFIGAYLAEGSLNYNEISITNTSRYYIENTKKIATMFGKGFRVVEKEGISITTKFNCEPLAKILLNTCGNGSYVKKVPDFAFTAPDEFKRGMFRGYFDGDGNFQCDKQDHQIRCCSRSEQLIIDLALVLNYFDIVGNLKSEHIRGSWLYHLNIPSKYAKIFQTKIGTNLHTDKLENLVKHIERSGAKFLSEQIDKINGMGEIVAHCGKTLQLPGQSRTYGFFKNKESIGRRTLEKYYQTFKEHEKCELIREELALIEQALNSGVMWDEIVHIEYYTPDQNNYVYDFTIPGNQTFVTDYGVMVHNTLNTFHFAGVASKSNVTRGVPRIEEILSLSEYPKNPSLTVYLREEDEKDKDKVQSIMCMLEHTRLNDIVKSIEMCFDPEDKHEGDQAMIEQYKLFENMVNIANMGSSQMNVPGEKSKWILRIQMDKEIMLDKNITMDDINFTLSNCYKDQIQCVYSDYNSDNLIFRVRMVEVAKNKKLTSPDQSDHIYMLKNFQDQLLQNVVIRGIKGINQVSLRKIKDNVFEKNGAYKKEDIWVIDTVGTNLLEILSLDFIDPTRTISNDIREVFNVYGIEAARQILLNELVEVVSFGGVYINYHNYSVLCDRMTFTSKMISISRFGINSDDTGPITKASFEETPEMFLQAARHAELDLMTGVSANIMCGQEGFYGTSCFQVFVDFNKMINSVKYNPVKEEEMIVDAMSNAGETALPQKLVDNNVTHINPQFTMNDDEDYNPGF
jgi:DNA-directed RNA polymerase II subunit RPB1